MKPTTEREEQLISILNQWGYDVILNGQCVQLRQLPIAGYGGSIIPYGFRSVQSACEHLIPIIHDDKYREAVSL